jgi:hypothetical protein
MASSDKKHLVMLRFSEEKYQQIKKAAESVEEPVTTWIRRACFQSLRKWEVPESKVLYGPCEFCGRKHNPNDHNTK